MAKRILPLLTLAVGLVVGINAHAWGRRGHAIVCETAALLLERDAQFMQSSTFDLGYYCNVPDLIWKKGDLYKQEWFNHFMDLEIFTQALKSPEDAKAFDLNRIEFDKRYPSIPNDAGRAWWRIRELNDKLTAVTSQLRSADDIPDRHALQAEWLMLAGAIGHYVGDLSQPLHVTENYDGQLSKPIAQKGIHAYFEDQIVDELYSHSNLVGQVLKAAKREFKLRDPDLAKKSIGELNRELSNESKASLPTVLKLDRRPHDRHAAKDAPRFRQVCIDRLAAGAVYLAEIWRRQLNWKFDRHKFYNFDAQPAYIPAPTPTEAAAPPKAP